jgi:3-hydroxyisobutyrate dehydrogenase-like beta-hydroxyacid dehydrogenase
MTKKVGVIGLGAMGSAMALRMVEAGYDVVGTDCSSYATNFLILIHNAATAEAMSFARKLQPTDSCISDHH